MIIEKYKEQDIDSKSIKIMCNNYKYIHNYAELSNCDGIQQKKLTNLLTTS